MHPAVIGTSCKPVGTIGNYLVLNLRRIETVYLKNEIRLRFR